MSERFDTAAALAQCDAAEERASKATPGPWRVSGGDCVWSSDNDAVAEAWGNLGLGDGSSSEDVATFIAAARNDVPELAAHLRAALAEIERLRAESDGRRREIERLEHERRTEWTRAERAEAEMERLRAALAVKS